MSQVESNTEPELREVLNEVNDDPKWDWARPLIRRRAMVVAAVAIWVSSMLILWIADEVTNNVRTLLTLALVGLMLLRHVLSEATQNVDTMPDELLDERQANQLREWRATSYDILSWLGLAVLIISAIVGIAETSGHFETVGSALPSATFALSLPVLVGAWKLRHVSR